MLIIQAIMRKPALWVAKLFAMIRGDEFSLPGTADSFKRWGGGIQRRTTKS